ncbi:hypothetical protein GCK32_018593, partial [Trichostrongylus colubriformis]
ETLNGLKWHNRMVQWYFYWNIAIMAKADQRRIWRLQILSISAQLKP